MTFDFTYPLDSGSTIIVNVEACVRKEELMISLTLPWGSGEWLDRVLLDAHNEREKIESIAWEKALELQSERLGVA